jgi:cytochrome c biogenesis protein CcmG, thiol:disulfide interchange protein DsbE
MISREKMRSIRGAVRGVAILAAASCVIGIASQARATAHVGEAAPSLVVPELSGRTFDLAAMRGRVVIVNFWATWCPPCRQEMPALDAFYRRYHGEGLDLIGLSIDRTHDQAEVPKVMQAFSYPAAILSEASINGFGTPGALPSTFVVDGNGVVRARFTPNGTPLTEKTLAAVVVPLLPHRPG